MSEALNKQEPDMENFGDIKLLTISRTISQSDNSVISDILHSSEADKNSANTISARPSPSSLVSDYTDSLIKTYAESLSLLPIVALLLQDSDPPVCRVSPVAPCLLSHPRALFNIMKIGLFPLTARWVQGESLDGGLDHLIDSVLRIVSSSVALYRHAQAGNIKGDMESVFTDIAADLKREIIGLVDKKIQNILEEIFKIKENSSVELDLELLRVIYSIYGFVKDHRSSTYGIKRFASMLSPHGKELSTIPTDFCSHTFTPAHIQTLNDLFISDVPPSHLFQSIKQRYEQHYKDRLVEYANIFGEIKEESNVDSNMDMMDNGYPDGIFNREDKIRVYNLYSMLELSISKKVLDKKEISLECENELLIMICIPIDNHFHCYLPPGQSFSSQNVSFELYCKTIGGYKDNYTFAKKFHLPNKYYSDLNKKNAVSVRFHFKLRKLMILTRDRDTGKHIMVIFDWKYNNDNEEACLFLEMKIDVPNLDRCEILFTAFYDNEWVTVVVQTIGEDEKRVRIVKIRIDEDTMQAKTTFSPLKSLKDVPKSNNYSTLIVFPSDKMLIRIITDNAVYYKILDMDMLRWYPPSIIQSEFPNNLFFTYNSTLVLDCNEFLDCILLAPPLKTLPLCLKAIYGKIVNTHGEWTVQIKLGGQDRVRIENMAKIEEYRFSFLRSPLSIGNRLLIDSDFTYPDILSVNKRLSLLLTVRIVHIPPSTNIPSHPSYQHFFIKT